MTSKMPCVTKIEDVAILHYPCTGNKYDVMSLSDAELEFCLLNETRKTGLKKLQEEKKTREYFKSKSIKAD